MDSLIKCSYIVMILLNCALFGISCHLKQCAVHGPHMRLSMIIVVDKGFSNLHCLFT